jgi:mannosyltransferase
VIFMGRLGRELYRASAASDRDEAGPGDSDRAARAFGFVTAGLVALSPYQVLASIEARMYALGTALAALGGWLLLRALREPGRTWRWVAYGLACIAFLYTHHYALFTTAAQFVFLILYVLWLLGSGEREEARLFLVRVVAVGLLVTLAYVPASQFLVAQTGRVQQDYWIRPLDSATIPETFGQFLVPVEAPGEPPWWGWAVFGAFLLTCALIVVNPRPGDAFVLALAVGPMVAAAAVSTTLPVWVPRYFRFAHLFVLTAVALAVWRVSSASRVLRASLFTAMGVGLLAANVAFWRALDVEGKPGPRGAVAVILAERRGDEPIVVLDQYQYLPIRYYAGRQATVRLLRPTITPFWGPHVIRPGDLIGPDAIADQLADGVWVVGNHPVPSNVPALEGLKSDRAFCVTSYQELHRHTYVNRYSIRSAGPSAPAGSCDRGE